MDTSEPSTNDIITATIKNIEDNTEYKPNKM